MSDVSLDPKQAFLKDDKFVGAYRNICRSDDMQRVLTLSFTLYSLKTPTPTQEQIIGVKEFLKVFLNFGEAESTPVTEFPQRHMTPPEQLGRMPEPPKPVTKKKE
jgi:hypothetical protein